MAGDSEYTGDMKMTFDPPMSGVSEMNMKMEGKWVGACRAGMKPGDVVMQGMPKLNMLELGRKPPEGEAGPGSSPQSSPGGSPGGSPPGGPPRTRP
jgi:hypothetical protein